MDNQRKNFNKLKAKKRTGVLLFGTLFGVVLGAFVAGALLIFIKFAILPLEWILSLAIGGGVALVAAAVYILVLFPRDRAFAKELDRKFGLDEQALTMIAYEGQDSAMLQLQREKAETELSNLPKKKLPLKQTLVTALCALLCVAILVSGLVLPQVKPLPPAENVSPPYDLTEVKRNSLQILIDKVTESNLKQDLKEKQIASLNGLMEILTEEDVTVKQMENGVRSTMHAVYNATKQWTSYDDYAAQFALSEEMKPLADAFYEAAGIYNTSSLKIGNYETVKSKEVELYQNVVDVLSPSFDTFKTSLEEAGDKEQFKTAILSFTQGIQSAIDGAEIADGDELKAQLLQLKDALNQVAERTQNVGEGLPGLRTRANNATSDFINKEGRAGEVMKEQSYACMMDEFILQSLQDIFGVTFNEGSSTPPSQTPEDDDDNSSAEGGGGKGDLIGNDELIYDGSQGKYVPLSQILGRYNATIQELLSREDVPDETKKAITEYLRLLSQKQEENN